MLPSAKILVVDDESEDVQAIIKGLNALGSPAVGMHFTGESKLPPLPCLRLAFLDLHLLPGGASTRQQIRQTVGVFASCLTPENGPYAIILWSKHVDELKQFRDVLVERFKKEDLPLPLSMEALDKGQYLVTREHREVRELESFQQEILDRIQRNPQLAALLGWEEHVSRAADDAIRQLFQIAGSTESGSASSDEINHLLGELAVASAGLANARQNVFRAANDVLVSVVQDRLIHRSATDETRDLWKRAVTDLKAKSGLSDEASGRLNRFLHFETGEQLVTTRPWERGSVLALTKEDFQTLGGVTPEAIWKDDLELESSESIRWLTVQVQAPCDQAQQREGLLPYVLGLSFLKPSSKSKLSKISKKKHVWLSPCLEADGKIRYLAFHFRFVQGLTREAVEEFEVHIRLREQILAELTHELHSYANRPGIIRFDPS